MKNSTLINVLKTFNSEEMQEFSKFISSPYFLLKKKLSSQILSKLFDNLKKSHPEFRSDDINKKRVFEKLYPDKEYNDSIMRNLISNLFKLAERFLIQKEFEYDEVQNNIYLIKQSYRRKLDKHLEKAVISGNKILEGRNKNSDYYYNKFMIADHESFYMNRKGISIEDKMQECSDYFFHFLIMRSLQIYMLLVNQRTIMKHDYKLILMDEVLEHLSNNLDDYNHIPEIRIYYNLLNLFIKGEEKYYYELKRLKEKHINYLDDIEQNNLYVCLGNFCIKKITEGKTEFNRERFELDKEYIKSGLLEIKQYIKLHLFLSIAMNAIELREYEWVEKFLGDYSDRLPAEYVQFSVNYLNAEMQFAKINYDESLNYLSKIKIDFSYHKQLIRNLTLKVYYETNSLEEAIALIDTSKHFLKRDKQVPQSIRDEYQNIFGYLGELINIRLKPNISYVDEKNILLKKLNTEEGFRQKNWIVEKVKELS